MRIFKNKRFKIRALLHKAHSKQERFSKLGVAHHPFLYSPQVKNVRYIFKLLKSIKRRVFHDTCEVYEIQISLPIKFHCTQPWLFVYLLCIAAFTAQQQI